MDISYVKIYFNTTSQASNADYKLRCRDPGDLNVVCEVPGQSATFVTPNKGLPPANGNNPTPPNKPADPVPPSPEPVNPTSPSLSPEPYTPPPSKNVSTDGSCGSAASGNTCLGSTFGDCCSSYGYR